MKKVVHFAPESVVHIRPESVVHFRPESVVHFHRNAHNTFDDFGSHTFQHHKSDDDIRALVKAMQPNAAKVANMNKYFQRPAPIGCALRVSR